MIILTSEYDYYKIKLNERRNIIEITLLKHEQTYGANYQRSVEVKCVAEFLDKIKNGKKMIIIRRYNFIEEINKIIQS